jgi:hypothetical protein
MERTASMGVARTFGFRWLLPLLLTSVHVGLLLVSAQPGRRQASLPAEVQYRSVAFQEDVADFRPIEEPRPLSLPEKVAVILNLPALLVGIPFAAHAFHGTDVGLVYAATPFVPLLWYSIGRWLDIRIGLLRTPPMRVAIAGVFRVFMVISGVLFVLFGAAALFRANHPRNPDVFLMGSALLLWGGLFFVLRPRRRVAEVKMRN